jgi:hypothetical protein
VGGVIVQVVYRPKPGQREALLALVERHGPTLRSLGLATDHPILTFSERGGEAIVELFEWASEEAGRRAHDTPEVAEMWSALAAVSDFAPLATIEGAHKPFCHFDPIAVR